MLIADWLSISLQSPNTHIRVCQLNAALQQVIQFFKYCCVCLGVGVCVWVWVWVCDFCVWYWLSFSDQNLKVKLKKRLKLEFLNCLACIAILLLLEPLLMQVKEVCNPISFKHTTPNNQSHHITSHHIISHHITSHHSNQWIQQALLIHFWLLQAICWWNCIHAHNKTASSWLVMVSLWFDMKNWSLK